MLLWDVPGGPGFELPQSETIALKAPSVAPRLQMETAAPKSARPNQYRRDSGLAGRVGLEAGGGLGHLVFDCVAQQTGGGNDAGRNEGEQ